MKLEAYLTIDDSPSAHTDALVDFLAAYDIPAQLFCRGDRMEQNLAPVVRAVKKGISIANHNYTHQPAGSLAYEEIVGEIEKTERLIDRAYREAGKVRTGKQFRFPYLDKGDGDRLERRFGEIIDAVAAGKSFDLPANEKVEKIQDWLKSEGFTQPYKGVTHPLYQNPVVADAADCLFTYSSCDWMLTGRHIGKWDYTNIEDLKRKIDDDPWLCSGNGAQIALFHDQPEIEGEVIALVRHMLDRGFTFLPVDA